MNLGELHQEIKLSLARGSELDSIIPGFVRRAAKWLERNYTFAYMRQFLELHIDLETATTPGYIELGRGAPKAINMFRWIGDDGEYSYLKRIEPKEVAVRATGVATGYWLDGVKRIVLSATPTQNLNGELQLARYTAWPANADEFEHWLIDQAEDVLIAQTLMMMAPRLRDPRLIDTYKSVRDEGLTTLINAEDEILYNDKDGGMVARPSGEWD